MAVREGKPNILIFMTDHQRGDTVLPDHQALTPNLNAFARQGVTFTNTFCPSPHCCPARATFMTGLYPTRHGVWNNICNGQALSTGLKPGVRCWSEDLNAAGYQTAYFGKWHVSVEEGPEDRGWRKTAHVSGGKGTLHGQRWEQWQQWAAGEEPTERGEGEILRPGWGTYRTYSSWEKTREVETTDDKITQCGIDAVREFGKGDDPWCVYVTTGMPHDPYRVPKKYLDMYDVDDVALPPSYADEMAGKPAVVRRMRRQIFGQLSEREVCEAIRHYWALCTYLDDLFGKLLAALEETGQADNTLVLYTADHGDYCGDHGLFCKGIPCYNGAYHVPAIVRWPKGIADPGRRVEPFVSLADFAPTFQQVAGCTVDTSLTGESLMPFLKGATPREWRDEMHSQCNGVEIYYTQRSVRTATHKYIYNAVDFDELYDLENDPDEMNNVIDDPAYESVKHDLVKRMWRFAHKEQDTAHNSYVTLAMAPWGPMEAFR